MTAILYNIPGTTLYVLFIDFYGLVNFERTQLTLEILKQMEQQS